MDKKTPGWALCGLIAILVGLGAAALDDYGVTWDEALGDFFFGERYLSFFGSLDATYLDFEAQPYPATRIPDLSMSPFRVRPWEYYALPNALAAATSLILSKWLGLLDPFDGFHAVNLWLGALFIWLFVRRSESELGRWGALLAVLLLFSAPRVVVHALANTKDFPEMVLFSSTLLVFHGAWRRGSFWGVIAAGALSGLALAAKANALFLPVILGIYVLWGGLPAAWQAERQAERWSERRHRRLGEWPRPVGAGVAGAGAGLLVFFASWPYLWAAPLTRLARHFDYVAGQFRQVRPESLLSPIGAVLGTTPIPFLVLILVGAAVLGRRLLRRDRFSILLVAWVVVVLGRLALPGAVNFDGVRHFLEVFPALALTAGVGAVAFHARAVALLQRRGAGLGPSTPARWLIAFVIGIAALAPSVWAVSWSHPHQIAYWNRLVGGVRGAHQRQVPQAGDYWGLSYRQGLRWIEDNLPRGSVLAVPVVEHAVRLVAQSRLRSDIGLVHVSIPTRPEIPEHVLENLRRLAAEREVYVMFVPRADWMNALMKHCLESLEPIKQWSLGGVPILLIYRYSAEPQSPGLAQRAALPNGLAGETRS